MQVRVLPLRLMDKIKLECIICLHTYTVSVKGFFPNEYPRVKCPKCGDENNQRKGG
jgi:transposase-like protein